MKFINLFKIANWELEKFAMAILSLQILVFLIVGLDIAGFQIPLLRELIAFIYLTFVPGILIIKVLKLRNLDTLESILYFVGLSIASLMFIGLFINLLYPLIGIKEPISIGPLLTTISIFAFILLVIACKTDDGFKKYEYLDTKDIISPWPLFLILIPFSVIIATYFVNHYNNVILIMLMVTLISIIPILIAFGRIPKKYYALTIFVVAISLLFHTALISKFIWGYDVLLEYHYADIVLKNSFWDPKLFSGYNGVLSVVMLIPIYSIVSNVSLEAVIKVIYPFIYSLVPLGLFILYKNQTDNYKLSFLSVFLFMASMSFFIEMVSLTRQEIAEVFLVLLLILFFSKEIKSKKLLYVILGISLMFSHYSIVFMYTFIFFGVWLFLNISRSQRLQNLIDGIKSRPANHFLDVTMVSNLNKINILNSQGFLLRSGNFLREVLLNYKKTTSLSILFVVFLLLSSILWYKFYVSSSYTFINLTYLLKSIILNISDILNPNSSEGLKAIMTVYNSPARMLIKYLYLTTQLLTIVGFLGVIFFKKYKFKFEDSFIAFSFFNLIILFASVILPNLAGSFNSSRFYELALIFLSPFFIIGAAVAMKFLMDKIKWTKNREFEYWLKPLSVFLTIFLLFNSGIVTEISGDYSTSMVLDKNDWIFFFGHDQDIASAQWLGEHRSGRVYGNYFSTLSFMIYGYLLTPSTGGSINDTTNDTEIIYQWTMIEPNSYIFVRYGDIKTIKTRNKNPYYEILSYNLTQKMDMIYDSNSEVYWTPRYVSFN